MRQGSRASSQYLPEEHFNFQHGQLNPPVRVVGQKKGQWLGKTNPTPEPAAEPHHVPTVSCEVKKLFLASPWHTFVLTLPFHISAWLGARLGLGIIIPRQTRIKRR
jgi:hypothetical protein